MHRSSGYSITPDFCAGVGITGWGLPHFVITTPALINAPQGL